MSDFIYGISYDPETVSCPHCGASGKGLYELTSSKTEDGVWFMCLDVEEKMRKGEPSCKNFFVSFN